MQSEIHKIPPVVEEMKTVANYKVGKLEQEATNNL